MKRFKLKFWKAFTLVAILAVLSLLLQSCEKPGCTNSKASNYDSDATEDDGSCIIRGCTDPKASNYDYEANYDDGSCHYPEGQGIFWTNDDYGHGSISVYVEGSYVGKIKSYYDGYDPDCGANGCVTITRPLGKYDFHATADDDTYWEGSIKIYSNDCSKMRLWGKKSVSAN